MSDRPALRIAFAFALALTIAQAADLEVTFIAPLVAGTLAAPPAPPMALLIGLPLIAWGLMIAVVAVTGLLASWPLALMLAMVGIFLVGLRLPARPRLGAITLLALVLFAVVPDLVMRFPEATGDMTDWVVRNCLAASVAVFLAARLFPKPPTAVPAPALPTAFAAPLPPLAAALALTAAWAVWIIGPPAPAAVLVSVVIGLRPDGEPPGRTLRDRFDGALLGAGLAIVGTALIELAHSLIVVPLAVMVVTLPLARRIAAGGPSRGVAQKSLNAVAILRSSSTLLTTEYRVAQKSLNAVAILLGQGLSTLYEDTDERLGIRIAGVVIGLIYAALILRLVRGRTARAAALPASW